MHRTILSILFYLVLIFTVSCLYAGGIPEESVTPAFSKGVLFADGFSLEPRDGWTLLRLTRPWQNAGVEFTYCLYPRGTEPPETDCSLSVEVPVERVVVLSTTYLASLAILEETDAVAGIDNKAYVYSAEVLDRVEDGAVVEIGEYPNLDMETLLMLDPDIIMTPVYGVQGAFRQLEQAGFPVVINGDWLETSALGRAEWIKFIAAFFGKDDTAEAYIDRISDTYRDLTGLVRSRDNNPRVFLNTPWQGTWYMPAGDSYQALLLEDAGAEYLWADTPGTGSIILDFEQVYSTAEDADFWLHTGSWRSREAMLQDDERFSAFRSFASGSIYNNDARIRSSGASDFWESGPVVPHLVLEDLIRIFHPGLLDDGELYFYRKIN